MLHHLQLDIHKTFIRTHYFPREGQQPRVAPNSPIPNEGTSRRPRRLS